MRGEPMDGASALTEETPESTLVPCGRWGRSETGTAAPGGLSPHLAVPAPWSRTSGLQNREK